MLISPVAYRPFVEATSSLVRAGELPDTPELSPYWVTLGRLVPEWRVGDGLPPDDSVVAIAEAVLRLLCALARDRCCVLVLEDLQWADPETVAIVEYLADNLIAEPVLCIVALRNDARSAAFDLARTASARRVASLIALGRLEGDDVAALVGSCLGIADVPLSLLDFAARAAGVPFLVEELLATAVASRRLTAEGSSWVLDHAPEPVVPSTFADDMHRRLARMGTEARGVLCAAAVLGDRFAWRLLPAATGLSDSAINNALHAGIDARIISIEGGLLPVPSRAVTGRGAGRAPPVRARVLLAASPRCARGAGATQ